MYKGHHGPSLTSNLTLTLNSQLQGHITIGFSTPQNLGVGEVSRPLTLLEMYKGHHDQSLTSNLTLTLTSQLQGHITIGLSTLITWG